MSTLHMIRFDATPWPCRVELNGTTASLHRLVQHSGQVSLAYPIEGMGELVLRTGTLPERPDPYSLPLELARGTLDRLRNQLDNWRESGLKIPPEVDGLVGECVDGLVDAVLLASEFVRQTELADAVLAKAMRAIMALCAAFVDQLAVLRRNESISGTELGIRLSAGDWPPEGWSGSDPEFGYVCMSTDDWQSAAESAATARDDAVRRITGPLWDAGKGGLPDEINQIAQFDGKRSAARELIYRSLQRVDPQSDWLYVVSGINGIGHQYLSYPQQMQLVVDALQLIEQASPHRSLLVSFDHPWSERLAWSVGGTPALQIADILLRQDVRVAGLGLEINLDYWPQGSLPRDPLQWLELIDQWGQFGLPLFLFLRCADAEPAAAAESASSPWRRSLVFDWRTEYLESVLGIALSRPIVEAVVWNDLRDRPDGSFPAGGLMDGNGEWKPMAGVLTRIHRRLQPDAAR